MSRKFLALSMVLVLATGFVAFANQPKLSKQVEFSIGLVGSSNQYAYEKVRSSYGYQNYTSDNLNTVGGITGRLTYDMITVRAMTVSGSSTWNPDRGRFKETDSLRAMNIMGEFTLSNDMGTEVSLRPGVGFGSKDITISEQLRGGTYSQSFPFSLAPTLEVGIEKGHLNAFAGAQYVNYKDRSLNWYDDDEVFFYGGIGYEF